MKQDLNLITVGVILALAAYALPSFALAACTSPAAAAGSLNWNSGTTAFQYCDGTTWQNFGVAPSFGAGTVSTPGWAVTGDTDTGLWAPAANTISMSAGGVEVERWNTLASAVNYLSITPGIAASPATVTISSAGASTNVNIAISPKGTGYTLLSGNVGIGTGSPNYQLEVSGTTGIGLTDGSGTTYDSVITHSASSPWRILTLNSKAGTGAWRGAINFDTSYNAGTTFTAMTVRANIDGTTANVGIGTTGPENKLHVTGAIEATGSRTTPAANGVTLSSESTYDALQSWNTRPLVLNGAGNNVGIGTSAFNGWDATKYKVLQVGPAMNIAGGTFPVLSSGDFITENSYVDTGGWKYATSAPAAVYSESGGTHTFRVAASGSAGGAITWTYGLAIDNNGNVGIGTATPAAKLDVNGTTILNGGNVAIGTTSASYRLDVTGAPGSYAARFISSDGTASYQIAGNNFTNSMLASTTANGTYTIYSSASGAANAIGVYGTASNSASYGVLGSNSASGYFCYLGGGSYSITCTGPTAGLSDKRLKTDIRPLEASEGLKAIMKLEPVHFRWKDERMNKSHPGGEIGFLAQNVETVLPLLVSESPQPKEAPFKLEGGMEKALQYDRLAAPLVKAVQQLEAENEDLRHEVEELRREIRAH